MTTRVFGGLALLSLLMAPQPPMTLQADSQLWVTGTSTVRDYKCSATRIDGVLQGETAASVAELGTAVRGVSVQIPVAKLSCGNGKMDDHMRKALKADANPAISYENVSHQIDGNTVTMKGKLTIAGTEKPVTLTATAVAEANGAIRVRGSKDILMTEWGVQPPSLMMGTLKVRDAVTVHFDMLLK